MVATVAITTLIGIMLGMRRSRLQQKRIEEELGREEEGSVELGREEGREKERRERDRDGKESEGDSQYGSHSSSQRDEGAMPALWLQQLAESGREQGSKGEDGVCARDQQGDQLPVLVLYSQQTPKEDVDWIHDILVGGLNSYNIRAWTPDTAPPRQLDRQWVEQGLRAGQAVLLICNREFDSEWQLPSEEGEFQIASAVKVRSRLSYISVPYL